MATTPVNLVINFFYTDYIEFIESKKFPFIHIIDEMDNDDTDYDYQAIIKFSSPEQVTQLKDAIIELITKNAPFINHGSSDSLDDLINIIDPFLSGIETLMTYQGTETWNLPEFSKDLLTSVREHLPKYVNEFDF